MRRLGGITRIQNFGHDDRAAVQGHLRERADRERQRPQTYQIEEINMDHSFRFGIEEGLFLADAVTREAPGHSLDDFHADVHRRHPEVERELLQSQVEIASPPSTSFTEARGFLAGLRSGIADVAKEHGMLLLASGTHPLADWDHLKSTKKVRYEAIAQEMQMVARRNNVCGMHVHVEVPDPSRRVELMNRLLPYLPLLLALSASSPFWQGRNTGLAAYRLSVWGELPRTGLPDLFASTEEYERYVATMIQGGAIKDASFLWWAIRHSRKYPTLELRVADSCTNLNDSITIAAMYRCLVRRAVCDPELNRAMTGASRALVSENLWRAQRDGIRASFIDESSGRAIPCAELLATLLELLVRDAEKLGCLSEIERTREIIAKGTSADQQLAIEGRSDVTDQTDARDAIVAVVDWIARTTVGRQG
jgi:glutamate---cysteine ligase / carboxylate-amine ligase